MCHENINFILIKAIYFIKIINYFKIFLEIKKYLKFFKSWDLIRVILLPSDKLIHLSSVFIFLLIAVI